MDPLFWIFLAALALPVALWLTRPWREARRAEVVSEAEQRLSVLLAEKESLMTALAELEVDYRAGKVAEEDYQEQRAMLMERAAAVLRELEALQARAPEAVRRAAASQGGAPFEAAPETRAETPPAAPAPGENGRDAEDDIEALLRARRQVQKARYVGFCPSCGAALRVGHRYCPLCGAEVPRALRRKRVRGRRG